MKRAHEYSLGVGGSPSPKKCKIVFDEDGKRIDSPETSPLKLVKMNVDYNKKASVGGANTKRVSKLKEGLVTPDRLLSRKGKSLNSTMVKQDKSALKAIDEKTETQKSAGKQIQQVKLL